MREAAADSNLAARVFRKARQETLRSGPGDQGELGCTPIRLTALSFPLSCSSAPSTPHRRPEAGAEHTAVQASRHPRWLRTNPGKVRCEGERPWQPRTLGLLERAKDLGDFARDFTGPSQEVPTLQKFLNWNNMN